MAEAHYSRVDSETGEIYQLVPEFNKMSLKPAIGKGWFDEYSEDVYPDDFCVIDGKKVRSPKYYDTLLERKNPDLLEKVKRARKLKSRDNPNNSPDRLRVREICLEAKLSNLKRDFENGEDFRN